MGNMSMNNDKVDELLNIKMSKLKEGGQILKKNVNLVFEALSKLDIEKYKDKYLCLSCIYGAFLGDSIGSCCEFLSQSPKNHEKIFTNGHLFKPGEVTDDSEMAISAAFGYIDSLTNDHSRIQDYLYYYFGIWRYSGPKDIGHATNEALIDFTGDDISTIKFDPTRVNQVNKTSLANGALMRISTAIAYFYYFNLTRIKTIIIKFFSEDKIVELNNDMCQLYNDIFNELSLNVRITHPNFENAISCSVFTLMVYVGMVTKNAKKVYNLFDIISKSTNFVNSHPESLKKMAKAIQQKYLQIIAEIKTNNIKSVYSHMGYYIHGFKLSVYFLHKYPDMGENKDTDLYYKIMCNVCDYGGDTDTNCAIVGTMIGALIGYKNFKKNLFDIFIKYIPSKRTQFNSAFIYLYLNFLEEKILNKINNQDQKEKKKIKASFHYTAYEMIKTFLNKNMDIK